MELEDLHTSIPCPNCGALEHEVCVRPALTGGTVIRTGIACVARIIAAEREQARYEAQQPLPRLPKTP